jgi:lipoate-protein ligase A
MYIWRLIPLEIRNAALNMAVDEAVLHTVSKGKSPSTIRFYRWNPSAVSLGYFQSLKDEVDSKACKRLGVDIVRRITGGGAVYHDFDGEITYSIIAKEQNYRIPSDIIKSYMKICTGVVKGLEKIGLKAEFKPINDVVVNGRKISGNAQTRRMGCVLQHGTILYDLNVNKMFTVLKVGGTKISDKDLKKVEERVTSIKRELIKPIVMNEVYDAFVLGFQEALEIEFKSGNLTSKEVKIACRISESRYNDPSWLNLR